MDAISARYSDSARRLTGYRARTRRRAIVTLAVACAVLAVASGCGGGSKSVAGCGEPSSAHYLRYKAVAGPGDSVTPATLTATVRIMCKRIDNLGVKHMHVAVRPPDEIVIGSDTPFPPQEPVVSNT